MIYNKINKYKNVKNAAWLIGGKIFQALLGIIVSMFTARYLGPSNYGLLSYAAAIVTFFTPIMQLGFTSVLVQEYTNYPEDEGKIMGTTIILSLISSLGCIVGVVCFTLIANAGETITTIVCALYSLMLIFQATEMIIYWFQAKLLAKYSAIVSLIAYIIVSAYKMFLLATKQDVYWFAISYSVDYLIISISLFVVYKKLCGQHVSFSRDVAKRVFKRSKYYILSGLMVTIFGQTDKIMLKLMLGNEVTAFYSAAISTAGMVSFLYAAIIDSFRPSIFQYKKDGDAVGYERSLTRLYSIVIYLALAQSVLMTVFSTLIIEIMYGNAYLASVPILQIVVWYSTFSYYGGAKDVWILGEEKQKYLILLNGCGVLMNIMLNYFFINLWGASGAAIASVMTQVFTNIIFLLIIKPLRHNLKLFLKALNPKVLIDMVR